jgi:hypothetical protein
VECEWFLRTTEGLYLWHFIELYQKSGLARKSFVGRVTQQVLDKGDHSPRHVGHALEAG